MTWNGVLIGAASFAIIGVFHPIVIKAEYNFGKRIWPLFLLAGLLLLALSLVLRQPVTSAILGVAGFSSLWSIRELWEQEERVRRGWFPQNPDREAHEITTSTKEAAPMEMRRKDLAVTDPEMIDKIILNCICVRLAFNDEPFPYVVPVNFGFTHIDGVRKLYFHGANVGRKMDLSRKLGKAGFEMDRDNALHTNEKACDFSMRYQSVIGGGSVAEITDIAEKTAALQILMAHYSGRTDWEIPESVVKRTGVFCLTVEEISAREHG